MFAFRAAAGANLTRLDPDATLPFLQPDFREHLSEQVLEEMPSHRS
jgi:hypothetical protein